MPGDSRTRDGDGQPGTFPGCRIRAEGVDRAVSLLGSSGSKVRTEGVDRLARFPQFRPQAGSDLQPQY